MSIPIPSILDISIFAKCDVVATIRVAGSFNPAQHPISKIIKGRHRERLFNSFEFTQKNLINQKTLNRSDRKWCYGDDYEGRTRASGHLPLPNFWDRGLNQWRWEKMSKKSVRMESIHMGFTYVWNFICQDVKWMGSLSSGWKLAHSHSRQDNVNQQQSWDGEPLQSLTYGSKKDHTMCFESRVFPEFATSPSMTLAKKEDRKSVV